MEANDLQVEANLDPRGMVGMFNVEDHPTLLYTKYASLMVIEKKISKKQNPIISLCKLFYPQGLTSLHPRGLTGRIYKCRIPLDIAIQTKYISCGPDGFRSFFPLQVYGSNLSTWGWPFWTPGA